MADTSYIDRLKASRETSAQTLKQQQEQAAMLAELKKMQMASLMGSGKSTVILTDQTDLGDKLQEMTTKAVAAIQELDSSDTDKQELEAIKNLSSDLQALGKTIFNYQTALERHNTQLLAAINAIDVSPQITVPEPRVTINEKAINFKPLEKAIESLKVEPPEKSINLGDYRVHDLADSPDGKQHIGYVAPDGSWYILESDDSNNTMRYCFGSTSYMQAWDDRFGHDYTTLSEAIHGLAA